jgi:hypothetical protein
MISGSWLLLLSQNSVILSMFLVGRLTYKSRRMRWAGHVARMGEERGSWCANRKERDHWANLGVDVWIIFG